MSSEGAVLSCGIPNNATAQAVEGALVTANSGA